MICLTIVFYAVTVEAQLHTGKNGSNPDKNNVQSASAAIVIGGFISDGSRLATTDNVEIIGCEGGARTITPYPTSSYLPGGRFMADEDGGHILVCGGTTCTTSTCYPDDDC